jgi:hypothetical protein
MTELNPGDRVTWFKREGRWSCGKFSAVVVRLTKLKAVIVVEGETIERQVAKDSIERRKVNE